MSQPHDHRAEVLKAFGLGPEDLESNRNGQLSPRQVQQLNSSGIRNLAGAFVIGLILAAILAFIAQKPLKPAQYITAGVLFVAVLLVGLNDLRKTRAAAADGRVETLTGPIQVQSRGKQGWFIVVSGKSFRLPVRPWNLPGGAHYHVYVSPVANRIVAMEPV